MFGSSIELLVWYSVGKAQQNNLANVSAEAQQALQSNTSSVLFSLLTQRTSCNRRPETKTQRLLPFALPACLVLSVGGIGGHDVCRYSPAISAVEQRGLFRNSNNAHVMYVQYIVYG